MMMALSRCQKLLLILFLFTVIVIIYNWQSTLFISVDIDGQHDLSKQVIEKVKATTHVSVNGKYTSNYINGKSNATNQGNGIAQSGPTLKHSNDVIHKETSTAFPVKAKEKSRTLYVDEINQYTNDSNFEWLDPSGTFLERIEGFNLEIIASRNSILQARKYKPWQNISQPLDVLWCNRDDFMGVLKNYTHVRTVLLKWQSVDKNDVKSWSSVQDRANVLVKNYYRWTATEPLCKWIQSPGYTNARWDAVYNRTCDTDTKLAEEVSFIEPLYFHGKPINVRDYWPNDGLSYPSYFYTDYPEYLIYMHIIEDSVVLETGDIISKNLKLVPYACSQDTNPTPPAGYDSAPIYSEIFLVSQFWGSAFFHSMIEGIPRLAPYLKFLKDNPSVLIHVVEANSHLKSTLSFLGINPERLVNRMARAKVLYVPQATPCGFPQIHELQLLNHEYRKKLKDIHGNPNRTSVIFIRRSGLRKFIDNGEMEQTIGRAAHDFGLNFTIFRDDPSPSMAESMQMFYNAALVVAPHGAGLSNVVYSVPGTYVIEGVCNEPHVNMCYQWTSHILGHRYHAIPSRRGCEDYIDIDPTLIDLVLRTFLQQIKWRNKLQTP